MLPKSSAIWVSYGSTLLPFHFPKLNLSPQHIKASRIFHESNTHNTTMISLSTCICALFFAKLAVGAPAPSSSTAVSAASSVSSVDATSAPLSSAISTSLPLSSSFKPQPTSTASAPRPTNTVEFASTDPNEPLWDANTTIDPQPIRGGLGAPLLGPANVEIDRQNADLLAPPTTDHGSVSVLSRLSYMNTLTSKNRANAKWPFSLSHNRLQTGGWARQENSEEQIAALLFTVLTYFYISWRDANCSRSGIIFIHFFVAGPLISSSQRWPA